MVEAIEQDKEGDQVQYVGHHHPHGKGTAQSDRVQGENDARRELDLKWKWAEGEVSALYM